MSNEYLEKCNSILDTEKKQRMYCESPHFKAGVDAMVMGKDYIEVLAIVCEDNLKTKNNVDYLLSRLTSPEAICELTRLFNS